MAVKILRSATGKPLRSAAGKILYGVLSDDLLVVGVYGSLQNAVSVKVHGNYMYVADSGYGTKIFDVSNPTSPGFRVTISFVSTDIFVDNDTLYIIGSSGFRIYNVSNPLSPSLVGSCALGTTLPQDVFVSGNYAYVADHTSGIQIIDISVPSAPTIVATYNSGSATYYSVFVVGTKLYAGEVSYIRVVDVSTPSSPSLLGSVAITGYCTGIKVIGNYLYSSHYTTTNGFKIFNISNPASITLVDDYDFTSTYAKDIDLNGDYAYVITGRGPSEYADAGVYVLNVSNPSDIVFVKFKYFAKWGTSVYYDTTSNYLFIVVNPIAYIIDPNF